MNQKGNLVLRKVCAIIIVIIIIIIQHMDPEGSAESYSTCQAWCLLVCDAVWCDRSVEHPEQPAVFFISLSTLILRKSGFQQMNEQKYKRYIIGTESRLCVFFHSIRFYLKNISETFSVSFFGLRGKKIFTLFWTPRHCYPFLPGQCTQIYDSKST